jgi:hypothetical protein
LHYKLEKATRDLKLEFKVFVWKPFVYFATWAWIPNYVKKVGFFLTYLLLLSYMSYSIHVASNNNFFNPINNYYKNYWFPANCSDL